MKEHLEVLKELLTSHKDARDTIMRNPFLLKDERKEAAMIMIKRIAALEYAIKAIEK